jgi:hypothetical protein
VDGCEFDQIDSAIPNIGWDVSGDPALPRQRKLPVGFDARRPRCMRRVEAMREGREVRRSLNTPAQCWRCAIRGALATSQACGSSISRQSSPSGGFSYWARRLRSQSAHCSFQRVEFP